MYKLTFAAFLMSALTLVSIPQIVQAGPDESTVFRRANFSNEFDIKTAEGINARGSAEVKSKDSKHHIEIHVNGLLPGATYVILNHWFEPVPERGVPRANDDVPSCTGHFQFLGESFVADKKGRLKVELTVDQLAPHIWVANFEKFLEVTDRLEHAPNSAAAFVAGGLLVPYADIVEAEDGFVDNGRLITEGPDSKCRAMAK